MNYTIEPHCPLSFRKIEHDLCDHTWAHIDSLATQERGGVTIVVRKYKGGEYSARILGLGCERFRVAWEGRGCDLPSIESAIHEAMRRLYPSHASKPFRNI
jgi:hypothetical protein